MTGFLSRLRLDPYILAIMAMVAVAALIPARGVGKDVLDVVVHAAIALLFFIYGAKLSPQAIWTGITHWRLQGRIVPVKQVGLWRHRLSGGLCCDRRPAGCAPAA